MRPFEYARPRSLAEALALLERPELDVRPLAGGTDLVIGLRDGSVAPSVVLDVKAIPELATGIRVGDGRVSIGATTTMTELVAHPLVRERFPSLVEAAAVVGSVQIRNRATLVGNICNASPAADTAPSLLVHDATVVVAGPAGERRVPIDDWFVRSGVTTLRFGELVAGVELPLPEARTASTHLRRTRRRGHDLASVTVAVRVDEAGGLRLSYGSLGPRPVMRADVSGRLTAGGWGDEEEAVLASLVADATPSATSMRASPEYRLAMLRVLARRALATATERLAATR